MDSYVVRIYRRAGKKSRILIGTAEVAGTGKRLGFSNIEELWEILQRRKLCAPSPSRRPLRKEVMRETAGQGTWKCAEGVRQIKPDFVL
jgi:hypothetical protein